MEIIIAPPPFPKPTQPFDTPEEAARAALQALLRQSIANRNEFGGMICRRGTKFYVSHFTIGERNKVYPGHRDENKGCMPVGAKAVAVAYFHTHPNVAGAEMTMLPDEFSSDDVDVAKSAGIDAYVGSVSGLFLKYDRASGKTYIAGECLRNADSGPVPDWKTVKQDLELKYEFLSPSAPPPPPKVKPKAPAQRPLKMPPLR
ncbi:hypothetical protein M2165_000836 [Variovorax sp. TBS-050B]|jgi:hypothetical protein|uniref:DUF4329 domain-containing protein n=1 Tax=Variovorax sp. TBS-050B TaxID=2940551 RepID=UPI002475EA26|nr:DUF4329 domain-containing protein [Variovorax sp. TBS-050B]MDH6590947.1 hypothetical protein [Variovorax sp. TBS-050B]